MHSIETRRAFLQGAGAVLSIHVAGCSTIGTRDLSPLTTADFSFTVTVLEQFTDDHPARIGVALTNDTGTPVTMEGPPTPPFSDYLSRRGPGDARLLLVPDRSTSDYSRSPLVWSGDGPPSNPVAGCWQVSNRVRIQQGALISHMAEDETISPEFTVFDYVFERQRETCLPAGRYVFQSESNVHRTRRSSAPDERDTPDRANLDFDLTVGFSLTIDRAQRIGVDAVEHTVRERD